jgi:formylglycine-generating enzyme required for sulfatase activity
MGSRDGEPDERPVHRVRITRGFWLGKYPVTLGQWKEFGRTAVGVGTSDVWAAGRNYPVDGVLHGRASSYCDHYGMRLPTEAEWEYAARGSESRRYPWGNQWDPKKCRNRYNMGPKQDGFPVGHFSEGASWCGALDMVGSVEQWCGDWFGYDYYSESPRSDPPGPATGEFRVKRGTWGFEVPGCRAAFRGNYPGPIFDVLINTGGVRCAVTP